ncbi:MAG TPA: DNA-directed RNA polymerase subunit omega [Patescibacteria group bacterium]|jgi:DNA-directed RNA polymerase subunit omega|nr:DNA-directed RNA polymerase subunit omega [Patescibacteria group bacterium]
MNAALVKKASELIHNSNVLINLVSRRVRQLNGGGRGEGRALLTDSGKLSPADIALTELINGKMSFDMPEFIPLTRPSGKDRNRPKHWVKTD